MNTPVIRYAKIGDLPAITAIYNYYVEHSAATFDLEPCTAEDRTPWFHEHGRESRHKLLVAEDPASHEIIGYACSSMLRPKKAYSRSVETSIYIHHTRTGQQTGTLLYEQLFSLLDEEGVHRIYACITIPNEPSLKLHRAFAFTPVGLFSEAGYKLGSYRDVIWMEKRL